MNDPFQNYDDLPIACFPAHTVSGRGGNEGDVLGIVNGIASWISPSDAVSIGVANGGTGITSYNRGDLLVAESSTTLGRIPSPGGEVALFSDNVNDPPAYRRILANDVDAGTFPGSTYIFTDVARATEFQSPSYDTVGATNLVLQRNNSTRLTLGSAAITVATGINLIWNSDNAADVGASGATRPRTGYFGTSLIVGSFTTNVGVSLGTSTSSFGGNVIIDSTTAKMFFDGTDATLIAGAIGIFENSGTLHLSSRGGVSILIDNDASTTTDSFRVYSNVTTQTGTPLLDVSENGTAAFYVTRRTSTALSIGSNTIGLMIHENLTDSAAKSGRIGSGHYLTAEEPVAVFRALGDVSSNILEFGGGTSVFNAATIIRFYTAADNITVTGTSRWSINSSGHFLAETDNTYDIGAVAATRARTIYAATSVISPLGTFATEVVTPSIDSGSVVDLVFQRNNITQVTIGSSTAVFVGTVTSTEFLGPSHDSGSNTDLILQRNNTTRLSLGTADITVAASINLIWATDNAADIGAVAANRPRTGYFGTSIITPLGTFSTEVVTPSVDSGGAVNLVLQRNNITQLTLGSSAATFVGTAAATEFLGPSLDSGSATDLILQRNNVTILTLGAALVTFGVNTVTNGSADFIFQRNAVDVLTLGSSTVTIDGTRLALLEYALTINIDNPGPGSQPVRGLLINQTAANQSAGFDIKNSSSSGWRFEVLNAFLAEQDYAITEIGVSTPFIIRTGVGANAFLLDATNLSTTKHFLASSANAKDLGAAATQWRTGYFGTEVVTPSIDSGAATDLLVQRNNVTKLTVGNATITVASGNTLTINETGGASLALFGAIADGDFLKRSGTNIIGGSPASSGFSFITVEVDMGGEPKEAGTFDITGLSGLTAGKQVLISQAAAAYTGKGDLTDEAEFELATATAYVFDATTIRVYWRAGRDSHLAGNVKWNYAVSG